MPQLKSKAQIVKRLHTERRRLVQNLARLRCDEMVQPGVVGQWSVKDILAHLADWLARMPAWVTAARRGELVESPEPGLTWKQLDVLNQRIYEAHRDQPLGEVLEYFHATYRQFMEMVDAMPDDEMLKPGRYAFTGQGAIYDWLSAYAAHDLWGKTHIRQWMKAHQPSEAESQPGLRVQLAINAPVGPGLAGKVCVAAPNLPLMYTIRPADSLDIDVLYALDPVTPSDHRRREFITRSVAGGACFVVATPDGQPAGCGVLDYSFYENGFISMLFIDTAYRRQGAATALLRHLACACQTPKLFTSTNLSNKPMQALLAKLGYRLSGVIHDLDECDPELVYVKYLKAAGSPRPVKDPRDGYP